MPLSRQSSLPFHLQLSTWNWVSQFPVGFPSSTYSRREQWRRLLTGRMSSQRHCVLKSTAKLMQLQLKAMGQCIPPTKHALPVSRYQSRHLVNRFQIKLSTFRIFQVNNNHCRHLVNQYELMTGYSSRFMSVNHFLYLPVVTNPENNPCIQMLIRIATKI